MKFVKTVFKLFIIFCMFFLYSSYSQVTNYSQNDSYGTFSNNKVLGNLSASGRYVAVPHSNALITTSGTIESWVYLNSYNPNDSYILQKGTLFGFGITNTTGEMFVKINNTLFLSGAVVPLNRWVHVAANWTTSNPNFSVSFFTDGTQTGFAVSTATMPVNTDSLTIGGSRLTPLSCINGFVDEVRLWNISYNASTIALRRFTGIGDSFGSNLDSAICYGLYYRGLIASWTFNSGTTQVFDDINNNTGFCRGGAAPVFSNIQGQPIPYNLTMYFPGRMYDFIKIPHTNSFNLNNSGTIDMWVNYVTIANNRTLISKGATLNSTSYRMYIESGVLRFQIGNGSIPGGNIPFSKWTHIAVSWSLSGSIYIIKFYINGQLSETNSLPGPMPLTTDEIRIGNYQVDNNSYFSGWLDEVRFWGRDLTLEEVKRNMFNSARSQNTLGPLISGWDFEGNFNDVTETGNSATIKTGNPVFIPWCTFSGYTNESSPGPVSDLFIAHSTTVNRNEQPVNPFPSGYSLSVPNKTVQQNTTVYDTIFIPGNVSLTDAELFLSLQHESMNGIFVKLRSPNGVERIIVNGNGGNGSNVLSFFKDGGSSQNSFFPPWTLLASPFNTFGNFGGSVSQGNWILSIQHNGNVFDAKLLGWGIRINNSLTSISITNNNIPAKYELLQCYPNPFNPSTEFRFKLPEDIKVKISVFDVLGREVDVIVNEFKKAGEYKVKYDALTLPSGVYFYTIRAGNFSETRKMVLIK